MVIKSFDQIRKNMRTQTKRTVAVASAAEGKTLEAVLRACDEGLVDYILTGRADEILATAEKIGRKVDTDRIADTKDDEQAAAKAVELIRKGEADFLQKGLLHTSALLKAVVNREKGLRTGRMMNFVAMFQTKKYHKLFAITDGGMQIAPNLEQKKGIIESTVELFHSFGVKEPKVACMCAVEEVNPKMPETVEAAALKEMNQRGEITGCIVEGPISFDLSMISGTSQVKKYSSPVAGDADIILAPQIAAGNMLIKSLYTFGEAVMGGVVLGGMCPVSMTSRDSSVEGRMSSLLLSCSILNGEKTAGSR
ncbi:MAG: bifunctional enoyl-CoA hydratase/phosphate acetyltransferase [Anaerovoracaceae bacterium]